MRKNNVALRLQASLFKEAKRVSETEGVARNQFINVAVAGKLSAMRTGDFFRERAKRGNICRAKQILKRAGRGTPPVPGDELNRSPLTPQLRAVRSAPTEHSRPDPAP